MKVGISINPDKLYEQDINPEILGHNRITIDFHGELLAEFEKVGNSFVVTKAVDGHGNPQTESLKGTHLMIHPDSFIETLLECVDKIKDLESNTFKAPRKRGTYVFFIHNNTLHKKPIKSFEYASGWEYGILLSKAITMQDKDNIVMLDESRVFDKMEDLFESLKKNCIR